MPDSALTVPFTWGAGNWEKPLTDSERPLCSLVVWGCGATCGFDAQMVRESRRYWLFPPSLLRVGVGEQEWGQGEPLGSSQWGLF